MAVRATDRYQTGGELQEAYIFRNAGVIEGHEKPFADKFAEKHYALHSDHYIYYKNSIMPTPADTKDCRSTGVALIAIVKGACFISAQAAPLTIETWSVLCLIMPVTHNNWYMTTRDST
jgi:hypothetical protein